MITMVKLFICCFVFLTQISGITSSTEGSCSCNDKWRLVATTSETGDVTQGSKTDLVKAVHAGADIRIQLPSIGYLTSVQNAHKLMIGDNICAQALFHISKNGTKMFQEKAYWWFLNVCTTGQTYVARYYVGINRSFGTSTWTHEVKWFIRPMHNTPLTHTSGSTVVSGNLNDLISDVKAGSDVRIVTNCGWYTAPMDSLEISTDEELVVGQSLYHVSQQERFPNYVFQFNAYWRFTNWVSDSKFQITRWTLGEHQNRGDSSLTQQMTWHTESCWELAYKHDASGNELDGSLDFLCSAILRGHRIKLLYGDTISVEPDEVIVRGGHVNAVILRMVTKSPTDSTMFDSEAKWDWRILTTTGTETTLSVNVGEYKEEERTTGTRAVAWFIDTRPWRKVLVNDKSGSVQSGSKSDLTAAFNSGARLRYTLKFRDKDFVIIHEADNLAISGNEVAVMHVRSVSIQITPASTTEVKFQVEPNFWFTISSTTGSVDMSRWTVGDHTPRGHTQSSASMEWFANF